MINGFDAMRGTMGDTSRGVVVTVAPADDGVRRHERVTREQIARTIAALRGADFAGEFDPAAAYGAGAVYFVPAETLVGRERASTIGIRTAADLFGAVVPHAFVATKSISHPLFGADAVAPPGWSCDFVDAVQSVTLRGYTAFARNDAGRAGAALLDAVGCIRVKRATGIGGTGQFVVSDRDALARVVAGLEQDELATLGVVLEENLADVCTFSVGRVEVAGVVATYCGTQELTLSNHGAHVYGGSDLVVARGEYESLLELDLAPSMRRAVQQARQYDRAADTHFAGFIASRRNYDVAQGVDHEGVTRMGVLEQSWRMGGASGAELCAVEAFLADATLAAVRARCVERYGAGQAAPPGARLFFDDVDARVGRLMKYTVIEPFTRVEQHAHAR